MKLHYSKDVAKIMNHVPIGTRICRWLCFITALASVWGLGYLFVAVRNTYTDEYKICQTSPFVAVQGIECYKTKEK